MPDGVAVLNADDALVAKLAEYCDGEVMYFTRHADAEIITSHLQRNGRVVMLHDGAITLVTGAESMELIRLEHVPLLERDRDAVRIDSVLSAVAAAWSLNITPGLIRAGLATFEVEPENTKDIV